MKKTLSELAVMPIILAGWILTVVPSSGLAAVEVGTGTGGSCFQIVSEIQRNWIELKRHLVPVSEELGQPGSDDFICVSPQMTRTGMPARTGMSSSVRCFDNPASRGLGYCCDAQLTSCAQLNPGLFPEYYQRPQRQEKSYERPASDWVLPPSDSDQWKSN